MYCAVGGFPTYTFSLVVHTYDSPEIKHDSIAYFRFIIACIAE